MDILTALFRSWKTHNQDLMWKGGSTYIIKDGKDILGMFHRNDFNNCRRFMNISRILRGQTKITSNAHCTSFRRWKISSRHRWSQASLTASEMSFRPVGTHKSNIEETYSFGTLHSTSIFNQGCTTIQSKKRDNQRSEESHCQMQLNVEAPRSPVNHN